jgi:hypothetical protein
MKKTAKKIVNKLNGWMADNFIHKTWVDEDEETITYYENVDGDVIVVERDEDGNVVDAWEE